MSDNWLPYGWHWLDDNDIAAVTKILRHGHLTQGEMIAEFEQAVAAFCGAKHAVAVANGTAALHCAAFAAGIGPGDEAITSPITFAATANCIAYQGGRPVFADIDLPTRNIDPREIERRITKNTRAILPVHFAGSCCDMPAIAVIAQEHGLLVIEDAAHAIGSEYSDHGKIRRVGEGTHSAMTILSFHPVKHITTGEGGMILTNDGALYERLQLCRSHGITKDKKRLQKDEGPWYYEMQALGYNYRVTDFQCALGLSQFKKLPSFIARRAEIVRRYNDAFGKIESLITPQIPTARTAWHLYVLEFDLAQFTCDRRKIFEELRERKLGVQVHYIPVHLQPYYKETFGMRAGDYPNAERYYERALSLPLYPRMSDGDVERVIATVSEVVKRHRK